MDGFYTEKEAASILGLTVRQIKYHVKRENLRQIHFQDKAYIPREDVEDLYDAGYTKTTPKRAEFRELLARIRTLERNIEVIKMGMGFGARRAPRTEAEILLLHSKILDFLARPMWTRNQLSDVADTIISLSEEDIKLLLSTKGKNAWLPILDLTDRMLYFIENDKHYPDEGLGTLHGRLQKSKRYFLGLAFICSNANKKIPKIDAQELENRLEIKPKALDLYVLNYIKNHRIPRARRKVKI